MSVAPSAITCLRMLTRFCKPQARNTRQKNTATLAVFLSVYHGVLSGRVDFLFHPGFIEPQRCEDHRTAQRQRD